MLQRLPPLQTLRAFEAAGRLLSMSRAAEELNLTHGAVSRHIKTLEDDLGLPLFTRHTRRIALTAEGALLLATVGRVLGELAQQAASLRSRNANPRLTISTTFSFASKWLEPRLHRLRLRHPDFDIHLDVTDQTVDVSGGSFDAAIRYGGGRYPHAVTERIMDETLTPVCNPSYWKRHARGLGARELPAATLLHEDRMAVDWPQWLARAGVSVRPGARSAAYSHGSMAIEAAIRGEGIALGRSVLVREDLLAGRLIAPFAALQVDAGRGYDLVYAARNRADAKIVALRNWLNEEVRAFLSDRR
ncbi:MAG: transcriptional regulator GcvA [Hyphomicrobiales bacterium]